MWHWSLRKPQFRLPLRQVLYRGHLGMALVAIFLAGLTVSLVCLFTLRAYTEHNLALTARSLTFTVEAAVVFGDDSAAFDALKLIVSGDEVARVAVYNDQGRRMASWSRPTDGARGRLEQLVATWLLPPENIEPILHDGTKVGEVRLSGSGGPLTRFLLAGLAGMCVSLALTALGALYLSRRMVSDIVGPLERLAQVAHAVRRDRDFAQRVPFAPITELDELGKDFNVLLDELASWQTHLKTENETLAHKASHDSLTHLSNRAAFEQSLSIALRNAAEDNRLVAVLFLDGDHFKAINDQHGHAAGDVVLIETAARIRSQLRGKGVGARFGGDEFAVLLAPLSEVGDAARIADDILGSMAQPIYLPDGTSVVMSLTVGIAVYPDHARSPEALLKRADQAMYHAKRQSRGTRSLADQTEGKDPRQQEIALVSDPLVLDPTARTVFVGPGPGSDLERMPGSGAAAAAHLDGSTPEKFVAGSDRAS
ncbi:diguanylate cyclase domain-containing protein [Pigmentiphaga aceris]|uniref:diguanylate cyclase domain-containing protein n=1 Tax=Pigmentiphaga aceris TaxID=1940612 RepID=UPI002482401D|nr:diguanylate cyclase [Pigmentiphaga aceris]